MSDNKINTGAIFKNKNKTATNHPDYKGSVNANGKDMDVALWLMENKTALNISAWHYRNRSSGKHRQRNITRIRLHHLTTYLFNPML